MTCTPTCIAVQLAAQGQTQRVTEAKAVAVLQYISQRRPVSGAVVARRGETPRVAVLTSFMVRNVVKQQVLKEKQKRKGKEKKHL